MAKVDQKRVYGMYSRLRWTDLIFDENMRTTRLGMKDWTFINTLKATAGYKTWKITPAYENRPDLISNLFYGNPELWWIISAYNSFFHPLKDFYIDRVIMIPEASAVTSLLI